VERNEVAWPGFLAEFQLIAPSHSNPALHHVQDRLQLSVMMRSGPRIRLNQHCAGPLTYFQLFRRHKALRLGVPAAPVNALHSICQNGIRRRAADESLKRIVLDLRRQGTADHQTRLGVISRRTESERLTAPCLWPACGVKLVQTISPASGTYRFAITRPLCLAEVRDQPLRGGSSRRCLSADRPRRRFFAVAVG
jgi:hypothetical protein